MTHFPRENKETTAQKAPGINKSRRLWEKYLLLASANTSSLQSYPPLPQVLSCGYLLVWKREQIDIDIFSPRQRLLLLSFLLLPPLVGRKSFLIHNWRGLANTHPEQTEPNNKEHMERARVSNSFERLSRNEKEEEALIVSFQSSETARMQGRGKMIHISKAGAIMGLFFSSSRSILSAKRSVCSRSNMSVWLSVDSIHWRTPRIKSISISMWRLQMQ